jgi:dihydroneopterin aldolase
MMTIEINGAEFFARHGFYKEEQLLGNLFVVDISVSFRPQHQLADKIGNTVDYEQLYAIVKEEMQHPRKLLETVAEAILDKIKSNWPFISAAMVSLKKLNPPMQGKIASSAVKITYHKQDNELFQN